MNGSNSSLVLVMYDISDNKKRYRFAKLLKRFGVRVQWSVFECKLNNSKYQKLCKQISYLFSGEENIRIYKLGSNDIIKTWGNLSSDEEDESFVFF